MRFCRKTEDLQIRISIGTVGSMPDFCTVLGISDSRIA